MGIKERLLEFIAYRGLNKARFEKMVGLSNGYVNSIKGSVGSDKLEKMLKTFPDLDRIWLMTGEGSMLKTPGHSYEAFGDGGVISYATGGYTGGNRQPMDGQSSQLLEALQDLVKSNTTLTDNNSKLVANNTKLVDKLIDFLDGE